MSRDDLLYVRLDLHLKAHQSATNRKLNRDGHNVELRGSSTALDSARLSQTELGRVRHSIPNFPRCSRALKLLIFFLILSDVGSVVGNRFPSSCGMVFHMPMLDSFHRFIIETEGEARSSIIDQLCKLHVCLQNRSCSLQFRHDMDELLSHFGG